MTRQRYSVELPNLETIVILNWVVIDDYAFEKVDNSCFI
jgi:hypothetical protein